MKRFIDIDVELNSQNYINIEDIKQLDDITITANIFLNGESKDITSQTISLYVNRPNGTIVQQLDNITKSENKIIINCKNSIFAVIGKTELEIRLVDSNGGISNSIIYVNVQKAISSSENYTPSEDEIIWLDEIGRNENERKISENTRITNEETRKKNEANRVNSENTRNTKENERQIHETNRESNENTRKSQENARVIAENTRKSNEDVRVANEERRATKIDSFSVGGRNLILNTAFNNFTDYRYWGVNRGAVVLLKKGELCLNYNAGSDGNPVIWSKKTSSEIIKDEIYTLSFYAKAQGSNTNKVIEVFMDDGYPRTYINSITVTTDYKKYTLTFRLDKNIVNVNNIQFMFYLKINNLALGNASMYIKDIKLERGTINTDHSLAYEDKNVIEVRKEVIGADKTIKATFKMDVGSYLVSATYDDNPNGSDAYRNNGVFILECFTTWDGTQIVNRLKITTLAGEPWGASWVQTGQGDKAIWTDTDNNVYIYKILTSINLSKSLEQWDLNIVKLSGL